MKTMFDDGEIQSVPFWIGVIACLAYGAFSAIRLDTSKSTKAGQESDLEYKLMPIHQHPDFKNILNDLIEFCEKSPSCRAHAKNVRQEVREIVYAEYENYPLWVEKDEADALCQKLKDIVDG